MLESRIKRIRRHAKIKARVTGDKARPRLIVFRSNVHIYAMLIDDKNSKTLLSVSDKSLAKKGVTKTEKAKEVGKLLATQAKKENYKKVVFDRAGYLYHGRVKALAEGAREEGLEF